MVSHVREPWKALPQMRRHCGSENRKYWQVRRSVSLRPDWTCEGKLCRNARNNPFFGQELQRQV